MTAVGGGSAFNRGSNAYGLSSAVPFQKVFVSVAASAANGSPSNADGFLQIDLPAPLTVTDVFVTFGASLPGSTFDLKFQIASPGGIVGAASAIGTAVVSQPRDPVVALAGQVVSIAPPASVALVESDTTAHFFRERSSFLLTSALAVDFTAVGTHTDAQAVAGAVPAGTRIDSHYLFADAINAPASGLPFVGSLTFDTEVLGIIALEPTFNGSNLVVGAPGTLYGGSVQFEGSDNATISANRRTVSFDLVSFNGADNMRIITASAQSGGQQSRLLALADLLWPGAFKRLRR